MNFWTFICIIIVIGVAGDAVKKAFHGSSSKKDLEIDRQAVKELTRRINELEKRTDFEQIERRVQALESIMVDGDYVLDMKFKKAFS
jgi:hypothetical protein